MTASAWTMTNATRTNLVENGYGDLSATSAVKCALFTSTATFSATSTVYSSTNEVASGTGYTTGGNAVTLTVAGTTSVTLTPSANITWTASGGSIVAYWAVIYEAASPYNILAYCLLDNTPASVTITSGNTLTISNSNPILTLA